MICWVILSCPLQKSLRDGTRSIWGHQRNGLADPSSYCRSEGDCSLFLSWWSEGLVGVLHHKSWPLGEAGCRKFDHAYPTLSGRYWAVWKLQDTPPGVGKHSLRCRTQLELAQRSLQAYKEARALRISGPWAFRWSWKPWKT